MTPSFEQDVLDFLAQVKAGRLVGGILIGIGPQGQSHISHRLTAGIMQCLAHMLLTIEHQRVIDDFLAPNEPASKELQ